MKQSLLDSHNNFKTHSISKATIPKDRPFSFSASLNPQLTAQADLKACRSVIKSYSQKLQLPKIFDRYCGSKVAKKLYPLRVNLSIEFTGSNIVRTNPQRNKKSQSALQQRAQIYEVAQNYSNTALLIKSANNKEIAFKDKNKQQTKDGQNNSIQVFDRKRLEHQDVSPLFMTSLKSPENPINPNAQLKFRSHFYQNSDEKVHARQYQCAPAQLKSIFREQLASKMLLRQAQAERGIMIVNYQEGIRYEQKMKRFIKRKT